MCRCCLLSVLTVLAGVAGAGQSWCFSNGAEFPGAKGALTETPEKLVLEYDFADGGHYVAAVRRFGQGQSFREISLCGEWSYETDLTIRFHDSTGQAFQRHVPRRGDGGRRYYVDVGKFPAHWGGANDGVVHQPIRDVALIAENRLQRLGGPAGRMLFRDVRFSQDTHAERSAPRRPDRPLGDLLAEAHALESRLAAETAALESRGLGAKSRASLATMRCFFRWIDLDLKKGFGERALCEADELVAVATNALARNERVRKGLERDEPQPRFVTSKVEIDGVRTCGERLWSDGRRDRGPVFFTGYGHFAGIQRDLELLPSLGNNILQMEIGPSSVLKSETEVDLRPFNAFDSVCARAEKAGVQVCLLLSPHYFPKWALEKWPELSECKGGFFGYCVHDERAQAIIERYLRTVVPLLRGKAALHSVCLSNEPEQGHWGPHCVLRRQFPDYLRRKYGTIGAMNAKWKSSYADFASVPVPENYVRIPNTLAALEFLRFSQERFSDFHRKMAATVHALAPEIPVHSKIMIFHSFHDSATFRSVDPEQFAQLSDYNGNDCPDYYLFGEHDEWAHEWSCMEAGYDLQRSCADKPVFNTENHIVSDREKGDVPADHVYSVLWQNALHGQSATTLWTWQRAYDAGKSDFNGLILERPKCFDAWARCALDLNRLADLVVPMQEQPPELLVHKSDVSSAIDHFGCDPFFECYRAVSFFGAPVGVCTDGMLERLGDGGGRTRPLDSAKVVLLPSPVRLTDRARAGLARLAQGGVRVIACGVRPLKDEFGEARRDDGIDFIDAVRDRVMFERLRTFESLSPAGDRPILHGADGRMGVWGVETRGYKRAGKSYLAVINHLKKPVDVSVPAPSVDLLTGAQVPAACRLEPERPLFLTW